MPFKFFNSSGQELSANLVANMPIGSIIDWAADNAPAGWLKCDGSSLVRTDYPELFTTIGTAYGSASGSTFNIPDISGSIIYASLVSRSGFSNIPVADDSVTTAKIANGAVTPAKLSTGGVALAAGYKWNNWNPSDVSGTTTNAPATAASSFANSSYLTQSNSSGTLTVTCKVAGIYMFASSIVLAHANVYTYNSVYINFGGTATRYGVNDVQGSGDGTADMNTSGSTSFLVQATADQTVTILPSFRVGGGGGGTGSHTAQASNLAFYLGSTPA